MFEAITQVTPEFSTLARLGQMLQSGAYTVWDVYAAYRESPETFLLAPGFSIDDVLESMFHRKYVERDSRNPSLLVLTRKGRQWLELQRLDSCRQLQR